MNLAWLRAMARLRRDAYAVQLCEERELQYAAIEEHAMIRGRSFVVLSIGGAA